MRGQRMDFSGHVVLPGEALLRDGVLSLVLRIPCEVVHNRPVQPGARVNRVVAKPRLQEPEHRVLLREPVREKALVPLERTRLLPDQRPALVQRSNLSSEDRAARGERREQRSDPEPPHPGLQESPPPLAARRG